MAILSKLLVGFTVLSAIVTAAPLAPRAYFTEVLTKTEWVTDYITDFTWVNDATVSLVPTQQPAIATSMTTQMAPTSTTATTTTSVSLTTPAAGPTTTTTTPAPALVENPTTTSFTTTTPAAPVITSTTTIIAPAPAPTTSSVQASVTPGTFAQGSGDPTTGSTDGTCEGEGSPCEGDVTYWTGGLGACGSVVDTNNQLAIALPYEFMGTLSNDNPYCGRSVTLFNPNSGTTVQATVMDKCMGCVDRAIDCTEELFNAITDNEGNGRYSGIVWWLD